MTLLLTVSFLLSRAVASGSVANDNTVIISRCALLLLGEDAPIQVSESDGKVIVDAGKAQAIAALTERMKAYRGNVDDPEFDQINDQMSALLEEPPFIFLGSGGHIAVAQLTREHVKLLTAHLNDEHPRKLNFPRGNWLETLAHVSATGRFLATATVDGTGLRILSARTGSVLLEVRSNPNEDLHPIELSFAAGDSHLTINRMGLIDIYAIHDEEFVLNGTYALGVVPQRLIDGAEHVMFTHMSSPRYLHEGRKLVGFYQSAEPLMLKLKAKGQFERENFESAPTQFPPNPDDIRYVGPVEMATYLANPHYEADGYVSPSGETVAAVRLVMADTYGLSAVDFFSTATKRFLGTLAVPHVLSQVVFSPSERRVAVSFECGVKIYDLRSSWVRPAVVINIDLLDGLLLSFPEENTILCGSKLAARLIEFEVPASAAAIATDLPAVARPDNPSAP